MEAAAQATNIHGITIKRKYDNGSPLISDEDNIYTWSYPGVVRFCRKTGQTCIIDRFMKIMDHNIAYRSGEGKSASSGFGYPVKCIGQDTNAIFHAGIHPNSCYILPVDFMFLSGSDVVCMQRNRAAST